MKNLLLVLIISTLSASSFAKDYLYLLEKPIQIESRLGPTARTLHYVFEQGIQVAKTTGVFLATGDPFLTLTSFVFFVGGTPPVMLMQSFADLKIRYLMNKSKNLKELATIPGVKTIKILSASKTKFEWSLATEQVTNGFVIIRTSEQLGVLNSKYIENHYDKYGRPYRLRNLDDTGVAFKLKIGNETHPVQWQVSLAELLHGVEIPRKVSLEWEKALREDMAPTENLSLKIRLKKIIDFFFSSNKHLSLEMDFYDGHGIWRPLGAMAEGRAVKQLIMPNFIKKVYKQLKTKKQISGWQKRAGQVNIHRTEVKSKGKSCISFFDNLLRKKIFRP